MNEVQPAHNESTHPRPAVKLSVVKEKDGKNADIRDLRFRKERVAGEMDPFGDEDKRTLNLEAHRRRVIAENLIARMQHYGHGFLTEDEGRYLLGLPRLG